MSYSKDDIQVLSQREAIRKRPGMYIGDLRQTGLKNLLRGTCLELLVELKAQRLQVEILGEGRYSILAEDCAEVKPESFRLWMENSSVNAVAPFWIITLNNLCSEMEAELKSTTASVCIHSKEGVFIAAENKAHSGETTSLRFVFTLDKTILQVTEMDFFFVQAELFEACCLCGKKQLRISEKTGQRNNAVDLTVNGLETLVRQWKLDSFESNRRIFPFTFSFEEEGIRADVFIGSARKGSLHSFVNGIPTPEHGSHVDGAIDGIVSAKQWIREEIPHHVHEQTESEIKETAVVIISAWMKTPVFIGSTRTLLGVPEVRKLVAKRVAREIVARSQSATQQNLS